MSRSVVLDQAADSESQRGVRTRPLRIVYANPRHFEEHVAGADWLHKTAEFEHRTRWVVYETAGAAAPRVSELEAAA
jgi:hypothetical protein